MLALLRFTGASTAVCTTIGAVDGYVNRNTLHVTQKRVNTGGNADTNENKKENSYLKREAIVTIDPWISCKIGALFGAGYGLLWPLSIPQTLYDISTNRCTLCWWNHVTITYHTNRYILSTQE